MEWSQTPQIGLRRLITISSLQFASRVMPVLIGDLRPCPQGLITIP
jgi:hypothetical protein